jgi:acetyltransferase-like isoleucine patch superfamily enzyme
MQHFKKKLYNKLLNLYFFNRNNFRVFFYKKKSDNFFAGNPKLIQPVLFLGNGNISFGKNNQIGYYPSPYFFNGYCHIEARTNNSKILFGNNITVNNNLVLIAEKEISIDDNVIIGTNVEIIDSDFHNSSRERLGKNYKVLPVKIKSNVWIGSNVKILKGVTIGKNSIISNSSVVTKDVPENVIVGGIPASIIKGI